MIFRIKLQQTNKNKRERERERGREREITQKGEAQFTIPQMKVGFTVHDTSIILGGIGKMKMKEPELQKFEWPNFLASRQRRRPVF